MKKLKFVKTFESFNNGDIDQIIEKTNNYLSNPKFISMVNKLPKFVKNYLIKFVEKNSFDIDIIEETIEKYNLSQKVKSIYDKGVRDVGGFIESILGKNMATVNEEIGLFGGTVIVGLIILVIGVLFGSEEILGFGMIVGIPVGIACLIAVLCGADNQLTDNTDKSGNGFTIGDHWDKRYPEIMKKPLVDENVVMEDTIKYNGENNDFIVLDNGDSTYTLLKKGDSGTYKATETK